jgi:hypothetical protein
MPVQYGMFESSATAMRAHALPSTKPLQGMPWLRGEATGLPGLRTVNLQRDHRSRLESSSLRTMEDVKTEPFVSCLLLKDGPDALGAFGDASLHAVP